MAPKPKPTGDSLLAGAIWMIAARWAMRLIGLVSTMVLARLLTPEDFGLVAMVMLAYGLLELVSYASVDLALMREGADSREHFDTAWTIQILQGLFIAVGMLLAAPAVAAYFNEPRAVTVVYVVALRAAVNGLQNIGIVWFRKDLDFGREFRFLLYGKLLAFVAVVVLALWLRDYWALVLGTLAATAGTVVLSYTMHPYRPRLSWARAGELWSFSQWLMVARVGTFLNRKCDEFMVGGAVGTRAMGSYHVANELATLPGNEIVMPVRRAQFPVLAKLVGQPEAFTRAVSDSFAAVAAICLFVSLCLWLVAPEFVLVVLGPQWVGAEVLMRWMAVFAAASALAVILEVPLWVAGRTQLAAFQAWLELALLVPLLWWAVNAGGAEGAASMRAGVSVLMVPVMMGLAVRAGNVRWAALVRVLWRPVLSAVLAGLVLYRMEVPGPALVGLVVKLAACGLCFPAWAALLWWLSGRPDGVEVKAWQLVRQRLSRA